MSRPSAAFSRAADSSARAEAARRGAPQLDIVSSVPVAEASLPAAAVTAGAPPSASPGGAGILPKRQAGPALQFERVAIELIDISADRLRAADPDKVAATAHSYGIVGQMQPIRLEERGAERFVLVAGLHRLLAARTAGWTHIDALVSSGDTADQRRLTEILENLMRAELVALDRAVALSELKAIHERMYPQTRKGGDRKSQAAVSARKNQSAILAFRSDVAEKTGLGQRTIERAVEIANGLGPAIRARLQGSKMADHQAGLLDLSVLDPALQHQVLDLLLNDPPKAANVAEAVALVEGKRPASAEPELIIKKELNRLGRWTAPQRARLYLGLRDEIEAVFAAEDARRAR